MSLDQQNDTSKLLLYSVNVMLQAIGERPVKDDTELANILEAQIAASVLIETKKEVLAEGWDFNLDENYTFVQDSEGYITVPYNVLDITDVSGDIVNRDFRLYSKSGQTAKFSEPQTVNVIWDLDFNSLNQPIRNFITIRAARKFLGRQVMDTSVYGFLERDEQEAFIAARRSEGFTGQYNMLTSGYGSEYLIG